MLQRRYAELFSAISASLGAVLLAAMVLVYPAAAGAQQCTAQKTTLQACLDAIGICESTLYLSFDCVSFTNENGASCIGVAYPEGSPNAGVVINAMCCDTPPDPDCCSESGDSCCGNPNCDSGSPAPAPGGSGGGSGSGNCPEGSGTTGK